MKYAIKTVIYKSWDWVRPPPPLLGQIPNFYRKFVLEAPLRVNVSGHLYHHHSTYSWCSNISIRRENLYTPQPVP